MISVSALKNTVKQHGTMLSVVYCKKFGIFLLSAFNKRRKLAKDI